MSRNVSKIQNNVFVKLSALLPSERSVDENDIAKTTVYLDETDFDHLAYDIEIKVSEKISATNTFSFVQMGECEYLLVTGDFAAFNLKECMEVEDNAAVFLLAIDELDISCLKDISCSKLYDEVFTGEEKRLRWTDIAEYFPLMCLYELKDPWNDYDMDTMEYDLRSLMAAICIEKHECLNLEFNAKTIQGFVNLINSSNTNIPIDNILHSMLANRWKFCFLDLYRTIERLFRVSWIHKYQKELECTKNAVEILKAFKTLDVETHEDKCMAYLFSCLDQESLDILKSKLEGRKAADFIYKMRNEIVHFQTSDNRINRLDDKTWNLIIQFMLMAIVKLYAFFRSQIDELSESI